MCCLFKRKIKKKEELKLEKEENVLGTEKIGKLIRKFSIPCIISLLVNSLYNIVDQIFIGQGVGYLGNGATNVVFPLTMIGLALSLMLGDGSSSYPREPTDASSTRHPPSILLNMAPLAHIRLPSVSPGSQSAHIR